MRTLAIASVSAGASAELRKQEDLCSRLLRAQPKSEPLLKRLLTRRKVVAKDSPFATIEDGRCSACNMTVALARVQQAKAGEFINCANCMRFLYCDPR